MKDRIELGFQLPILRCFEDVRKRLSAGTDAEIDEFVVLEDRVTDRVEESEADCVIVGDNLLQTLDAENMHYGVCIFVCKCRVP